MPQPETILQFGTGKFLRCFVDLFAHELNQTERPAGRVVVVQSTGAGRVAQWSQQGRYHVAVRGLAAGALVDRVDEVQSIGRALAASADWPALLDLAASPDLQVIVSNTTEAGFALDARDAPTSAPPRSFPAKLLTLLQARYQAGQGGVRILPCELLEQNGLKLRDLVLEQAARWQSSGDFLEWLRSACTWHNTLVDRIVSSPSADDPLAASDPLFAVAEPFAFWGVDGPSAPQSPVSAPPQPAQAGHADRTAEARGDRLLAHPAVHRVDDLGPYYLRKVRILNGAHTALVAKALPLGLVTVRQAVEDPRIRPWLESLLFEEIVPLLEDRTEEPAGFARTTLERFANPFLEHRLADIALHHAVKLKTRIEPSASEYRARFGRPAQRLEEVLAAE